MSRAPTLEWRRRVPRRFVRVSRLAAGVYAATGVFVCFEGGEGSGKSTQSRLLARLAARARGTPCVLTFEPGDTEVGREIRQIVLDPATGELSDRTEALLYAADKAEHVDTVVAARARPGRGGDHRPLRRLRCSPTRAPAGTSTSPSVERVARWATGDLRPHLTVRARPRARSTGSAGSRSATGSRASRWSSTSGCATAFLEHRRGRPRPLPRARRPRRRSTRSPPRSASRRRAAAPTQARVASTMTVWDGLVGQRPAIAALADRGRRPRA